MRREEGRRVLGKITEFGRGDWNVSRATLQR